MQKFMEVMVMGAALATLVYAIVMVAFGVVMTIASFSHDYEDHKLITANRLADIDRQRRNEVMRYGEPRDIYPGGYYPPVPYSQADVAVWYIQHNRKGWAQDPIHATHTDTERKELGW